jgi:hypothetical protein
MNKHITTIIIFTILFQLVITLVRGQNIEGKWRLYSYEIKGRESLVTNKTDRQTLLLKKENYAWKYFNPIFPNDSVTLALHFGYLNGKRRTSEMFMVENGIERKIKYSKVKAKGSYKLVGSDSILFSGDRIKTLAVSINGDRLTLTERIEGVYTTPVIKVDKFIRK